MNESSNTDSNHCIDGTRGEIVLIECQELRDTLTRTGTPKGPSVGSVMGRIEPFLVE
jgi:hypothetical protein